MCIIRVTHAVDNYDNGNNHDEDMLNPNGQDERSPSVQPQLGRPYRWYSRRLAHRLADRPEAGNQHDPNAITVAKSRRRQRCRNLVRATDATNRRRD